MRRRLGGKSGSRLLLTMNQMLVRDMFISLDTAGQRHGCGRDICVPY